MTAMRLIIISVLFLAACSGEEPPSAPLEDLQVAQEAPEEAAVAEEAAEVEELPLNPSTGELLPMPFAVIWAPALVDYEQMIERRAIRVVVPYGGYQFYYDEGRPRGAVYELVQRFEGFLNEQLGRRNVKVYANGFQVPSFVPGGQTMKMSGTSMASPNVCNLAAKLFTLRPELTPTEVVGLIEDNADPHAKSPEILLMNPKASVAALN